MKKKILFLIPTLSGGGAEKVLLTVANALDTEKYEIYVQTILNGGVYEGKLSPNVHYRSIVTFKNSFLRKAAAYLIQYILPPTFVYKHFIRNNYDVEIAYLEGTPVKLIAASDNEKASKYTWVHIDLFNYYIGQKAFRNLEENIRCYQKYDKIYCVSQDVKSAFIKRFGITENVEVQYNVIDDEEIREKANLSVSIKRGHCPMLITVGRLCHQKGFERLVRVIHRLAEEKLMCELHILGDGEDRDKLLNLIHELNLQENIVLHGFTNNPYNYMKAADIFVCSSFAEGFSTVATEALILGKAIITTDCSGMRDLLGNSEYGVIVENSEDGLYQGLRSLLSCPERIQYYSKCASERSRVFTKEARISEYEKIMDRKNEETI